MFSHDWVSISLTSLRVAPSALVTTGAPARSTGAVARNGGFSLLPEKRPGGWEAWENSGGDWVKARGLKSKGAELGRGSEENRVIAGEEGGRAAGGLVEGLVAGSGVGSKWLDSLCKPVLLASVLGTAAGIGFSRSLSCQSSRLFMMTPPTTGAAGAGGSVAMEMGEAEDVG